MVDMVDRADYEITALLTHLLCDLLSSHSSWTYVHVPGECGTESRTTFRVWIFEVSNGMYNTCRDIHVIIPNWIHGGEVTSFSWANDWIRLQRRILAVVLCV